jgi:polyisoprenoid-binding protein YceI
MKSMCLSAIIITLVLSTSWAQTPNSSVYNIDAARSKIEIAVFREGLLKGVAHDHTVAANSFAGEVRFNSANMNDSSVNLSIDSGSLVVLEDPKVPEKDRKEIQATMQGSKVLNIKEFPKIMFHSTGVSNAAKAGEDFTLTGKLDLHGVVKEITFPVHIQLRNNLLQVTGMADIAQTDFAIKPIKLALGTIRLKDQIRVRFEILAERTNP